MSHRLPFRVSLFAAALGFAAATGSGCALAFWRDAPDGPAPDRSYGVEVVRTDPVLEFHTRATRFYSRLALRRFNTYATYTDSVLRDHFRTQEAYFDYYADFAQALTDSHFERNRPLVAELLEFSFEAPGRARVHVLLKGDNGLPLRWWGTVLERQDVWERVDGTWWLSPEKL